jgi:hypothetical protein
VDFSDEPYVRKYTRKTVTSRLLGWEGRAVMDAMLGEFDAAGVFDFRGDVVRSICAVTDIPEPFARVGLERLTDTETWLIKGHKIVWPTYEEAQNCNRSDRVRQRASRKERARKALADVTTTAAVKNVTAGSKSSEPPAVIEGSAAVPVTAVSSQPVQLALAAAPVTVGHSQSQPVTAERAAVTNVTAGHSESQPTAAAVTNVTAGHSESQPTAAAVTNVTAGHSESQLVTLPPSLPLLPSFLPPSHGRDPDPDRAREKAAPEPDPKPAPERATPPPPPATRTLLSVPPERAREPPWAAPIARTLTMPSEEPPQEYLDEATMRAVPREQAISTWRHYYGAGLPERGVERLHAWLCARATERAVANARVSATWPEGKRDRKSNVFSYALNRINEEEARERGASS